MSMMDGIPDHCPNCGERGFSAGAPRGWWPSRPARPDRFFGLRAARPARGARFRYVCAVCGFSGSFEKLNADSQSDRRPPRSGGTVT